MGCTRRSACLKLRLPLALPEILLGINQTILLAVSMLVITALVGTRDLGQEVYIALTRADVGAARGLARNRPRLRPAPRRRSRPGSGPRPGGGTAAARRRGAGRPAR